MTKPIGDHRSDEARNAKQVHLSISVAKQEIKMLSKTMFVLAAGLIFGAASAALAGSDTRGGVMIGGGTDAVTPVSHPGHRPHALKASSRDNSGRALGRARASYAQAHERLSPSVDPNPSAKSTSAIRPLTPFERNWFDFQNQESN
jgi:hypothetical protein